MTRSWTLAGIALGLMIGGVLLVAGRAEAQPYGGCKEAFVAPHSKGANDCRREGWIVRSWVVISPAKHIRYLGANRLCLTEDQGADGGNFRGCFHENHQPGGQSFVVMHGKRSRYPHGIKLVWLR